MRILSPVPSGSGAVVVHRQLEANIPGYRVVAYSPWFELVPFILHQYAYYKVNLIHTAPDYAIFVTRRNKPLIITFHNYVLDAVMQQYSSILQRIHYRTDLRLFTKLALQQATVVTAVSQFTASLVRHDLEYKQTIRVIPNGIDTMRFKPKKEHRYNKDIQVLFSGNMTIRKGAPLLPEIAKYLKPGIRIVCASGLRGGDVRFSAKNIKVIGQVAYDSMPTLYSSVDILLMPTVREGMSLAVLEAMACGLPVIATDCSSLPELIEEGKGGFLCRMNDAKMFAEKLNLLAEYPQLRGDMGEYNRTRIEECYSLPHMIRAYQALFDEVLSSSANRVMRSA